MLTPSTNEETKSLKHFNNIFAPLSKYIAERGSNLNFYSKTLKLKNEKFLRFYSHLDETKV